MISQIVDNDSHFYQTSELLLQAVSSDELLLRGMKEFLPETKVQASLKRPMLMSQNFERKKGKGKKKQIWKEERKRPLGYRENYSCTSFQNFWTS